MKIAMMISKTHKETQNPFGQISAITYNTTDDSIGVSSASERANIGRPQFANGNIDPTGAFFLS